MAVTYNGISVILCCYNSATRLPKTLKYLAAQSFGQPTHWELIIVNNNSTDATKEVAKVQWKNLGTPAPLNVVDEEIPGLSFARDRGMAVANYEIYLFCDDDNWLQHDYLDNVLKTFNNFPEVGALGGWSSAIFESEKPAWFDTFAGNFAVGKPRPMSGTLNQANEYIYGAGMALNKKAIVRLKQTGFKQILSDRKGTALSSGGDVELIYALKLLSLPVMYSEALFFYHFMPNARMNRDYLIKLRQSMYWSNFVLNIYMDTLKNKPIDLFWMLKKVLKSLKYIYIQKKKLKHMDANKTLFLKNQIEIRILFLKHLFFYYKTRVTLKKMQNA